MKTIGIFTLVVAGSLVAANAEGKGEHGNSGRGHAKHGFSLDCPPGLAKKNPPCVPPGQAKKVAVPVVVVAPAVIETTPGVLIPTYHVGAILPDDYVILADPRVFNPMIDIVYVRYLGYLYVIERASAVVLLRLGPVSDWTWAWDGTDSTACPPGLAKKDPPCVPPGLAAQPVADGTAQDDPYGIGESLPDGYTIALDPELYTPNERAQFVREGDEIYRADASTGAVLDDVGIVGKVIQ